MGTPVSPELLLAGFVLLLLVALVVLRPLLAVEPEEPGQDDRRASLEAAKEAKYREIRDAELDFRMGKVSEEDYRTTDRELRAQAISILQQIDAIDGGEPSTGR
jgi:hypothetical protein